MKNEEILSGAGYVSMLVTDQTPEEKELDSEGSPNSITIQTTLLTTRNDEEVEIKNGVYVGENATTLYSNINDNNQSYVNVTNMLVALGGNDIYFNGQKGITTTFETTNGLLVTVTNGLITDIQPV